MVSRTKLHGTQSKYMHLSHDSVSQSSRAGPPYPRNKMVGAVLADPDVSRRKSTPENLSPAG